MSILSWWRRLIGGSGPGIYYPGGLTPPVILLTVGSILGLVLKGRR